MKKMILFALLLLLAGAGIYFSQPKKTGSSLPKHSDAAKTAQVVRKTLRRTVESTGEVRPENRLEVKSPISGRIEKILPDEGSTIKKGEILAWISSTERATILDTARAQGGETLAYWEDIYKAAPLIAPMAGTVIARDFEPGQTITASDAVVVIADRLIIVGQVDETDIGFIFPGQSVTISLDAYSDRLFKGRVKSIAYDSDIISNVTMYEVDVASENPPALARSGMTATLTFEVEIHENVPVISTSALEYRDGKIFVQLVQKPGDTSEIRPVQTGLSENSFTEITQGLVPGDRVLIPKILRKKESGSNPFLPGPPKK